MQISIITTEQFVEIYEQLTAITEHNLSSAMKAYSGILSGSSSIVIFSDPTKCLMLRSNVR